MTEVLETRKKLSLWDLRVGRGLSRESLADELGVSSMAIRNWERFLFRPAPHHLQRLAAFFGVNENELDLLPARRTGAPAGSQARPRKEAVGKP